MERPPAAEETAQEATHGGSVVVERELRNLCEKVEIILFCYVRM